MKVVPPGFRRVAAVSEVGEPSAFNQEGYFEIDEVLQWNAKNEHLIKRPEEYFQELKNSEDHKEFYDRIEKTEKIWMSLKETGNMLRNGLRKSAET